MIALFTPVANLSRDRIRQRDTLRTNARSYEKIPNNISYHLSIFGQYLVGFKQYFECSLNIIIFPVELLGMERTKT